jgi:hypothetical protein
VGKEHSHASGSRYYYPLPYYPTHKVGLGLAPWMSLARWPRFWEMCTRESASIMTQERPMLPREGRMADAPHVSAGLIRLPSVSLPTEKGTVAATTLATGPEANPKS